MNVLSGDEAVHRICSATSHSRLKSPVMVLAGHPDDEIIGAGSRLPLMENIWIVHVTDGAPENMEDALKAGCKTRRAYLKMRREEAVAALLLAGIKEYQLLSLGIKDQKASFSLSPLVQVLVGLFKDLHPEIVLLHAYEGGHPDHDAVSCASQISCNILKKQKRKTPVLVEYASYHVSGESMAVNEFLPESGDGGTAVPLSTEARNLKQRMMQCFLSQLQTLSQFSLEKECFRKAPNYDFSKPPHTGRLFYEHFSWGITGEHWRKLAREALIEFGI